MLRKLLEDQVGTEEANKRIYATTDRAKGTLKQLADSQGWPTFVVPDDVGGRYSVLSAVGLLPIAAAGIDIAELMKGAADAMERFSVLSPDNDAYKYAAARNILSRKGKQIEILECYEPNFALMNEWYKQLFGESEGKDNKGCSPPAASSPPTCTPWASSSRKAPGTCSRPSSTSRPPPRTSTSRSWRATLTA